MNEYDNSYAQEAEEALQIRAQRLCRSELLVLGFGMFLYMVSTQLSAYLLAFLLNRIYPLWFLSTWVTMGLSCVSIYGVGTVVLYMVVRRVRTNDIPGREPLRMNATKLLTFFCVSYAGAYFSNILTLFLASKLSSATGSDITNPLVTTMESASSLSALGLYMLLLAPIMEELVFRHILLVRLRKYGDSFAMLVSAAAFGLFHTNLHQILYAFVIGLFLAYVALRTGHVLYTILLHACINAVGFGAHVMNLYASGGTLGLFGMFVIGLIFAGVVLAFTQRRNITITASSMPVREAQKWLYLLINPGVLLFLAYVVYATIRSNFR